MNLSLLTRSDNGGLGTLSRLIDFGLPIFKRLAINRIQGERGDFCREPDERTRLAGDSITVADAHWVCEGTTHLMSFEVWYGDLAPRVARQMGVRTVLLPNYECCVEDSAELRETDIAACATGLDLEVAENATPGLARARKVLTPIPCDTSRIKFHPRQRAETFLHRVGHQGEGRNGSIEIIRAWPLLKAPAKLVLYHQGQLPCPLPPNASMTNGQSIECRSENPPNYWDMWDGTGDLILHPTRHDALSLPIQEALTSGLPVIAANWWPHCDDGERTGYLPAWSKSNAVPIARTERRRISREFTSHHVSPEAVAARVDALYGSDIQAASLEARQWAEDRSWAKLRGQWIEAISCTSKGSVCDAGKS